MERHFFLGLLGSVPSVHANRQAHFPNDRHQRNSCNISVSLCLLTLVHLHFGQIAIKSSLTWNNNNVALMSNVAVSAWHALLGGKWQTDRETRTWSITLSSTFSSRCLGLRMFVKSTFFNKAYLQFTSSTAGLFNSWVTVLAFLLCLCVSDSYGQRRYVSGCQFILQFLCPILVTIVSQWCLEVWHVNLNSEMNGLHLKYSLHVLCEARKKP